jgi:hypothetical protein
VQAERFRTKTIGKSKDELRRLMVQEAGNRANYEITRKEIISEDEVRLYLRVQTYPGHPNVGNDVQVMQKIGDEWKYAGKYGVDVKEGENPANPCPDTCRSLSLFGAGNGT